ncbi:PLAC8-like protein 1 [Gracilinanus agilis]|uniref:PLAC8-like protein 1 n=1 Tax=Gracilinanus agilis TaxID=191870 RepID=UPI001CFDB36B|nr:PLAC8-like protein 1 [Gracilinanus agilis]
MLSLLRSEDQSSCISDPRQVVGSHIPTQPVTTQPSWGACDRTTITTIVQAPGDWSTSLFNVCSDKKICFCGLFCTICLECNIARHYGECLCWPLLPNSTLALRVGTRERHKIRGTLCEDWLVVCCCWPFSVCQMARELKMKSTQTYEVCTSPSSQVFGALGTTEFIV